MGAVKIGQKIWEQYTVYLSDEQKSNKEQKTKE